jgi:hypothetical protein
MIAELVKVTFFPGSGRSFDVCEATVNL